MSEKLLRFLGLMEAIPDSEKNTKKWILIAWTKAFFRSESRDDLQKLLAKSFLVGFEEVLKPRWWQRREHDGPNETVQTRSNT